MEAGPRITHVKEVWCRPRLCDQDLFSNSTNFMVKKPSPLSDHSPILTWLHVNTEISFSHIVHDYLTHLPKQFIWEIK